MKYLYLLFISLLCCILITCSLTTEDNDLVNERTLIHVYVDNSFAPAKQEIIKTIFNKWSDKTNYRVVFDIQFVSKMDLKDTAHILHTYYVFERIPKDPQWVGFTTWAEGAVIEIKPNLEEPHFTPVFLHEIGHALRLPHYTGDNKSLMGIKNNSPDIMCQDLRDFCVEWKCGITCEIEQ